jgi:type IV secretory pathway protease TraF
MNRRRLIGAAIALPVALGWVAMVFGHYAFLNTGRSMPVGWYVWVHAQPAAVGEVVAVRDVPRFKLRWLLKRVEGVAGDSYCWDPIAGTQRLNGRLMPPPDPRAAQLGIDVWRGCRTLRAGEIVGYGQSADSFDARYLGPIAETHLWGVYRRLL